MTRPISKDTTNELLVNIVGLRQQLDQTRKALEIIKKEMSKETMPDFAVIHNALKTALEQKDVK